jgi:hypothetical protein
MASFFIVIDKRGFRMVSKTDPAISAACGEAAARAFLRPGFWQRFRLWIFPI